MIIKLVGADFSDNNINNTLKSWTISNIVGTGATYDGPTSVEKGAALNATVTLDDGYEIGSAGVTVTMGGAAQDSAYSIDGNVITISIASVTGAVVIKVPTKNTATGEEDSGTTTIVWLDLPVTEYALGVTSNGTGRVSTNNTKRFSTADDTNANGILIPAGQTMHLKGLASGTYPLRVDYIYGTKNVACPASSSTTPIEGLVGTCSNYNSSNYFPLNKSGADTLDITNTYGQDYYFWFGFAGQNLTETILNEFDTYDIKYYIA